MVLWNSFPWSWPLTDKHLFGTPMNFRGIFCVCKQQWVEISSAGCEQLWASVGGWVVSSSVVNHLLCLFFSLLFPPFLLNCPCRSPRVLALLNLLPPPDLWRGSEQTAVGVLAATPQHHRKGTLFTHVHLGLH